MPKLLNDLLAAVNEAREAGDMDAYNEAQAEYTRAIASMTAEEKLNEALMAADDNIRIARGERVLTSEEKGFYAALVDAVKSNNFRNAITETNVIMPETIIESIFDDLTDEHPIFAHLDVKVVNQKVKMIYAKSGTGLEAQWGAVDESITKEVSGSFEEVDAYQNKITAFLPLPLYLMDLGYPYIDRFVRTLLSEAMLNGFEKAVVTNNVSGAPIGMVVDTSKAGTTASGVTTYVKQTATAITELTAEGLKNVMKKLGKTRNGHSRPINGLFMVINPNDYYTLIKPAINVRTANGGYVDILPYNITFVRSIYMEEGKAILGLDKQYILAIGTAYTGKIEYSDEFKFLEDKRTYKIKAYGHGQPKDANSFVYLNIANLKPAPFLVETTVNGLVETTVNGTVSTEAGSGS